MKRKFSIATVPAIAALCLALFGLTPFGLASLSAEEHTGSLKQRLMGVWDVEEGVNQGEEIPEKELEGTVMKIEKNVIITYDKDQREVYRAMFTLDETKKPVHIDMMTEMKGMPPMKSLGIIKIEDGDEFELCYALPGAERPTKFKSTKENKTMLFEAERED
ncbi:TIGR03067 domain-containing protein [Rhodopirellula sp. JC740]|uniref:TIGR03067 domain-containing protein n=1 Tax=Rhodopirellula halodulae TaxID=2894198 RepID=A0ABS8NEP6_9BACT|nr:TIGR03067 domain-containing protein [Rhodopirellula sp. JC740]MCC9642029.1 TIGR03067 domain-containing protein [Rhodopirellula sp. JC740]